MINIKLMLVGSSIKSWQLMQYKSSIKIWWLMQYKRWSLKMMHYKVAVAGLKWSSCMIIETIMEPASIAQAMWRVPSLKNWEWWVKEILYMNSPYSPSCTQCTWTLPTHPHVHVQCTCTRTLPTHPHVHVQCTCTWTLPTHPHVHNVHELSLHEHELSASVFVWPPEFSGRADLGPLELLESDTESLRSFEVW